MDFEKGFVGGFLVLGVIIFVAGFLAGMLFLGTVHVSSDAATIGLMSFALGLITGMVTIALVLVVVKIRETKISQSTIHTFQWTKWDRAKTCPPRTQYARPGSVNIVRCARIRRQRSGPVFATQSVVSCYFNRIRSHNHERFKRYLSLREDHSLNAPVV